MTFPDREADVANDVAANWDVYRYFLAVAQSGSISAAAKILGDSQPTVGRKIRELERVLGTRLLERTTSGVVPTSSGAGILSLVERIAEATMAIRDHVQELDARIAGKITVTAPEGLGVAILAPRFADFCRHHPELDLELLLGASKLKIVNGEADIAVRVGDPVNPSLTGRRVGEVQFGLFASPAYREIHGLPANLDLLADHPLIDGLTDLGQTTQSAFLRQFCPNARRILRTNNISAQMAAAQASLGIVMLPKYLVGDSDGLIEVLGHVEKPSDDVWILTRNNTKHQAPLRAVMDFLIQTAQTALRRRQSQMRGKPVAKRQNQID